MVKNVKGSGRGLVKGTIPVFARRDEEDHEILSQDSQSPSRDFEPESSRIKQEC
jgi:hypothetical protein